MLKRNFFRADSMNSYEDFYGKVSDGAENWDDVLTGKQLKNRVKTMTMADQIMAGARVQGKDMDVVRALESAHLLVSKDVQEQAIRERIKSDVKKRDKSLSINPSVGKKNNKPTDPAAARKELEAKVSKKLADLKL